MVTKKPRTNEQVAASASTKRTIELAPIPTESWAWDDSVDYSIPAPTIKATFNAAELPFKAWFAKVMTDALAGKQPSKFVPLRFFKERSTKPEGMTLGTAQGKVRDQFRKWLADQPKAIQDSLDITFAHRTGREQEGLFKEPGVQFWVLAAKPVEPAKQDA